MHKLLDMTDTYFVTTPTKKSGPCDSCNTYEPLTKIESSTHCADLCKNCLNTTPIIEWTSIATPVNNVSMLMWWILLVLIIVCALLG
jgi:hypothetical protein